MGLDAATTRVAGSYLSPYVRKVLVALDQKQIAYQIDPIVPFMGNDEFSRVSPIRRIPVLLDDQVTLCDSSVICEYLEERYPEPALFPRGPALRARARWLEEFADTRMGEVFIWRLFNQRVINRFIWGQSPDEALIQQTMDEAIPSVLGYLEEQVPASGFLFERVSVADVAIACFFRNLALGRITLPMELWPRTAAFVERVLGLESFARLRPFEEALMRAPVPQHREVLTKLGAPLTPESYGTQTARRGVMRI